MITHINNEFNRLQIYARNKDVFRAKIRAKNIFKLCDKLSDFRVNDQFISEAYLEARNSLSEWEENISYKVKINEWILSKGYDSFVYNTRININTSKIQSYINMVKIIMDRPKVKMNYNGEDYIAHVVLCGFGMKYYVIKELDEWIFV